MDNQFLEVIETCPVACSEKLIAVKLAATSGVVRF